MTRLNGFIVGSGAVILGAILFSGCATPAVVFVSPTYHPGPTQKVALLDFDDYPGLQGSGSTVADIFEKYLIPMNYELVDRTQADQILQQQNISDPEKATTSQLSAWGKMLGVDAFILGSISAYTDTSAQTVMEDMPQEETDPVYGDVTTRQHAAGQTITTHQTVVTGYATTYTEQTVPVTETVPATVGINARLVNAKTGTIYWSGSGSGDGRNLSAAAENASSKIIKALQKSLKTPTK